jgi:hypothetical protein
MQRGRICEPGATGWRGMIDWNWRGGRGAYSGDRGMPGKDDSTPHRRRRVVVVLLMTMPLDLFTPLELAFLPPLEKVKREHICDAYYLPRC